MAALAAGRTAASEAEVARAIAALDERAGLYFGCDAGVPGLHPQQACLIDDAALALRVHASGVRAEPLTESGADLLRLPSLVRWQSGSCPGAMRRPVESLRLLLGQFKAGSGVRLAGALQFAAHRLAGPASAPASDEEALGVLYLPASLLERDAHGAWWRVSLDLLDALADDARGGIPSQGPGTASGHDMLPATLAVPAAAAAESPSPQASPPTAPRDDFAPGGHAAMVARAVERLADPALVSLTLSQSFRRRFDGSPAAAFARLRTVNPAPVVFFVNDASGTRLFGASPDLQLVVSGGRVRSLPVCGTVARRPGAVGEAASFQELVNESVDAASLAVCSDAMRNDLAALCVPGSLRLSDRRRPMSLATVVHTVDQIEGQLRPGVDAWDAIAATAAPVMLTGTPRSAALAAIADLEASARGWYGGLIVDVRSDGTALVGTLLRAAAVRHGVAEVRTGGDLLADSDPAREEAESRLKALSLWRALGLETGAPASSDAGAPVVAPELSGAIALLDAGDPFIASLRDCLASLGLHVNPGDGENAAAALAGSDAAACDALLAQRGLHRLLACGDAAVRVLARSGFAIRPHPPRQGRSTECTAASASPWQGGPTLVGVYGSAGLDANWTPDSTPAGWSIWATDADGRPLALANELAHCVCLLYRPDSLLCGPDARGLLVAALELVMRTASR